MSETEQADSSVDNWIENGGEQPTDDQIERTMVTLLPLWSLFRREGKHGLASVVARKMKCIAGAMEGL